MRELARRVRTPEDVDALVRALDGGSADALRARLRVASPIRTTFASGDFDTIDANEDGVIDRDEWNAAHDANKDGVIDRDEWNAVHGIGDVRGRKPCLRDLTWDEMRALAFVSSVPFVGFGFCDNMIMIMSGDIIESHLGVAMGLSTMGAAAMGNLVSDVLGISLVRRRAARLLALGNAPRHNARGDAPRARQLINHPPPPPPPPLHTHTHARPNIDPT